MFPARRHFVPVIVIFMFAIIESGREAWRGLRRRSPLVQWISYSVVLALCALFVLVQFVHPDGKEVIAERWEWDGKLLGLALKKAFAKQQPLVAVTASGCIPYWSELPALDLLGINDYYLPRHPPADMGAGIIGHELGDGRLRAAEKAGYHCLQRRRQVRLAFRSGFELSRTPRFFEEYTSVHCQPLSADRDRCDSVGPKTQSESRHPAD